MKQKVIVFTGYNLRAVIAFLRTLEANDVTYSIIAKSANDDIFQTKYANAVSCVRKTEKLILNEIINFIKSIQKEEYFNKYLIAPSTEYLNRFVLKNIEVFEKYNCIFPTVRNKLYDQVSDKYSFSKLCQDYDIEVPKEINFAEGFPYPIVAKPKKYFSSSGDIYVPKIIKNEMELVEFRREFNSNDFYFQEYVGGRNIYLLYYFDNKSKFDKFSQENFMQQEEGKSMLYSKSTTFHNQCISKNFERLFRDIKFRGLVMIEVKLFNNRFIMIEANPRFWGPSQLFVDSETNLFESLLIDYDVIDKKISKNLSFLGESIKYFWNDGVFNDIDTRNNLSFYSYSKLDFLQERDNLIKFEIFNKNDTIKLHKGA